MSYNPFPLCVVLLAFVLIMRYNCTCKSCTMLQYQCVNSIAVQCKEGKRDESLS